MYRSREYVARASKWEKGTGITALATTFVDTSQRPCYHEQHNRISLLSREVEGYGPAKPGNRRLTSLGANSGRYVLQDKRCPAFSPGLSLHGEAFLLPPTCSRQI